MGFLDDMRKLKQAAEEQPEGLSSKERIERAKQQLAGDARHGFESDWMAPGAEWPYVEYLSGKRLGKADADLEWRPSVVEAYLTIVGLRPDDTFGIWTADAGETGVHEMAIGYRDRPEYARGRERFAAWRDAQ